MRPATDQILRQLRWTDPGFVRARLAAGALFGLLLGGGLAAAVLTGAGRPIEIAALAAVLALIGVITLPTGGLRPGLAQMSRIVPAAIIGSASATLLSSWPAIGYGVFVVVMALGAWLTRWDKVGMSAAMALFMSHVLPTFLDLGAEDAPWCVVAVLCGGSAVVAVAALLRVRPARQLRDLLPAFDATVDRQVRSVLDTFDTAASPTAIERIRDRVASVQAVALQIDTVLDDMTTEQVEPPPDHVRDLVLTAEVLADHLLWSVATRADELPLPIEESTALRAAWREDIDPAAGATSPRPPVAGLEAPGPSTTLAIVTSLRAAMSQVATTTVRSAHTVAPPPDDALEPVRSRPPTGPPNPSWRKVVQVVVGGGLAMVIGLQLSDTYWLWAVIGAFVVVVTTPSRGVGLRKAADRTLGTAIGVGVGLALGTALSGRGSVELVAILALMFAALWVIQASYTWMVVLITAMVAVLYDLTGQLTTEVLALRLAETVVGTSVGAVVAYFVVPSTTRSTVIVEMMKVLDDLDAVLAGIAEERDPSSRREAIRQLDRSMSDLLALVRPIVTVGWIDADGSVRAARLFAVAMRFRVRSLAAAAHLADPGQATWDGPTVQVLNAVRHHVHDLRADLGAEPKERPPPGDLSVGQDVISEALRDIAARVVAYRESLLLEADPPTT